MASTFLTAEWRKLAIANYAVDPTILQPHLPFGTELDDWQGNYFVSVVAFRFLNTKLKGFAVPFHRNFEEANLRFYVKRKHAGVWKRGVCFIKEIVPRYALSFVANTFYGEKYVTMPMRSEWSASPNELAVSYSWKYQNGWDLFSIRSGAEAIAMAPESKEEFITEHYWGYSRQKENSSTEYQVTHPRWLHYPVLDYSLDIRFADLYGKEFSVLQKTVPDSVMLAEGSLISVLSKSLIK